MKLLSLQVDVGRQKPVMFSLNILVLHSLRRICSLHKYTHEQLRLSAAGMSSFIMIFSRTERFAHQFMRCGLRVSEKMPAWLSADSCLLALATWQAV